MPLLDLRLILTKYLAKINLCLWYLFLEQLVL